MAKRRVLRHQLPEDKCRVIYGLLSTRGEKDVVKEGTDFLKKSEEFMLVHNLTIGNAC